MNPMFLSSIQIQTFAVHSIKNNFCTQCSENGSLHKQFLTEVTKDYGKADMNMYLRTLFVPCLLSSFKNFIVGCSNYHLSLMERTKLQLG